MEKTFNNIAILPFNLESFKKGAKVVNKFGKPARFITEISDKILVEITSGPFNKKELVKFNKDGKKYSGTETSEDLYMVA